MALVLMIDDDPMLQDSFTSILERNGFNVIKSRDGEDGLIKAEAENPDIIVLDMLMPKLHGIEFLKRYDLKNKHPNVKVLVLSSMDSGDLIHQAMELGAWRYAIKLQTSPKSLLGLINEAFGQIDKANPVSD